MRWHRSRFTIRHLLIAVAVAALLLGAEMTRRRALHFAALARSHAQREDFDRLLLDGGTAIMRMADGKVTEIHGPSTTRIEVEGGGTLVYDTDPSPGYGAAELQGRVESHARLRRKYERAARSPWLPVEPDVPEPR